LERVLHSCSQRTLPKKGTRGVLPLTAGGRTATQQLPRCCRGHSRPSRRHKSRTSLARLTQQSQSTGRRRRRGAAECAQKASPCAPCARTLGRSRSRRERQPKPPLLSRHASDGGGGGAVLTAERPGLFAIRHCRTFSTCLPTDCGSPPPARPPSLHPHHQRSYELVRPRRTASPTSPSPSPWPPAAAPAQAIPDPPPPAARGLAVGSWCATHAQIPLGAGRRCRRRCPRRPPPPGGRGGLGGDVGTFLPRPGAAAFFTGSAQRWGWSGFTLAAEYLRLASAPFVRGDRLPPSSNPAFIAEKPPPTADLGGHSLCNRTFDDFLQEEDGQEIVKRAI
jgi:hypothetical protein